MNNPQILIVEDDLMQQRMLSAFIEKKLMLTNICAGDGRMALKILNDTPTIKLVILDLDLPILHGMEVLNIIGQRFSNLPVIILTGNDDVQSAVEAMKRGALDFITKPYDPPRLMATIKNALKLSLLSREIIRLKAEQSGHFTFLDLIGHENGLETQVKIGRKAAQTNIPVLITGETGTGKDAFARAIHGESPRHNGPFIAVNCGALPGQLIESILFGHEKGAFTGATDKTIGKFREAEGGTIFLDEIGELPLDAQVKLLRVLQQQEIEPVGAGKTIPVNVRILSATNRNLEQDIKHNRFREDLYFRLNVLEINLPPLRERKIDIPFLMRHFIDRFSAQNSFTPPHISPQAEKHFMRYNWPGNVRELENTLHRALVLDEDGILDMNDLLTILDIDPSLTDNHEFSTSYSVFDHDGALKPISTIERDMITLALRQSNHNVTKAAENLGIAKSTFYRKMQEYRKL